MKKPSKSFRIIFVFALAFLLAAASFKFSIRGAAESVKASLARKRIMDFCEGYNISKSKNSIIYFTQKDEKYAQTAEGIINTYLPLLCADFGLDKIPYVTLIIFPNEYEMYGSIGYNADNRSGKSMPMGAFSAGIIAVLSPSYWADSGKPETDAFISDGPIIHEMAHLALDKKTKGNYNEWFSEGVALFYENKYTGYEWTPHTPIPPISYAELSSGFRYIDERESYRKSYEIIKYIASQNSTSTLKKIYDRLESGNSLDTALRKELGKKYNELDNL